MGEGIQDTVERVPKNFRALVAAAFGSTLGLATLAFCAGFLAQRAQSDVARLPSVYIDYWAYAETGLFAFLRSLYVFLQAGWPVALIAASTIGIIVALRSPRFREKVLRPEWALAGQIMLLLVSGLLVRQQLQVRGLSAHDIPADAPRERASVPAVAPFDSFVADELPIPESLPIPEHATSFDAWEEMANELEDQAISRRMMLEVRPVPQWVSVRSGGDDSALLGVAVSPEQTDSERAESLYGVLVITFGLATWVALLCVLWNARLLPVVRATDGGAGVKNPVRKWCVAHCRELWFSCRFVAQPLVLAVLFASGAFLMPECYGALAMRTLGNELVEIVVSEQLGVGEGEAADGAEGEDRMLMEVMGALGLRTADANSRLLTLASLASRYALADEEQRLRLLDQWNELVSSIEREPDADSAQLLERVVAMSRYLAPALAVTANDALTRLAARFHTNKRGYILHYPRSENEYLRLVTVDDLSATSTWSIHPVATQSILEVRVAKDEMTRAVVDLLRGMRALHGPIERQRAFVQLQLLGHPKTLEFMLAGLLDPNPAIRGAAITAVGAYASALEDSVGGTLRRRRAAELLLRVVENPMERTDIRGAGATALAYVAANNEFGVGDRLLALLTDPRSTDSDPQWLARGTMITALARMRYLPALDEFIEVLQDPEIPKTTRASIPTALAIMGSRASIPALRRCVTDPDAHEDVIGTAVTALTFLGQIGDKEVIDALADLLKRPRVSPQLQGAAIVAMHQIGDASALPLLHSLAFIDGTIEGLTIGNRAIAINAVGQFRNPLSEEPLIAIAEDRQQAEAVRDAAVDALGGYSSTDVATRLYHLAQDDPALSGAIIDTLEQRGDQGNGRAQNYARQLKGELDGFEEFLQEIEAIGEPEVRGILEG